MPSRPPPPENVPKDEESESGPLDRFKSLAKGLFGVAREDLEKAEKRFKERGRGLKQPSDAS